MEEPLEDVAARRRRAAVRNQTTQDDDEKIHVPAAASPRLVRTEYPRPGRGVAATRFLTQVHRPRRGGVSHGPALSARA